MISLSTIRNTAIFLTTSQDFAKLLTELDISVRKYGMPYLVRQVLNIYM